MLRTCWLIQIAHGDADSVRDKLLPVIYKLLSICLLIEIGTNIFFGNKKKSVKLLSVCRKRQGHIVDLESATTLTPWSPLGFQTSRKASPIFFFLNAVILGIHVLLLDYTDQQKGVSYVCLCLVCFFFFFCFECCCCWQ